MNLGGLHHVTAVTAGASKNVAFYTETLGLRLVKKTVNQDDVSAYHLFYGDEQGHAGTELTFFEWPVGPHVPGAGMISATAFRVPGREALDWWLQHFEEHGVSHGEIIERAGRTILPFSDPEGQALELVDDSNSAQGITPGTPWSKSTVPAQWGIRGLAGVTLTVKQLEPTTLILTGALGFKQVADYEVNGHQARLFEVGPGGPGSLVQLIARPDLPYRRMVGAGGVHHVAFRVATDEEHRAWRPRLIEAGLMPTPVIDRFYFRSIYFREPGGVLFELATDGPGFATDEDLEHLGETLALPPFLEKHRQEIEANLQPITLNKKDSLLS